MYNRLNRSVKGLISLLALLLVLQTAPVPFLLSGNGVAEAADAAAVSFTPTNDAHVQGGTNANTNYGTSPTLAVKYISTDLNLTRQAFMKFEYNTYAGDVGNAILHLYGSTNQTSSAYISIYGVEDDTWTEGTITWNKKPAAEHYLGTARLDKAGNWIHLDVTSYVRSQTAKDNKASFAYVLETSDTNTFVNLYSKENTANCPYLELSPQRANGNAPSWPANAGLQVSNEAGLKLSWPPASDPAGVTAYRIYRNGTLEATVEGNAASYPLSLETGKKYTYKVEAGNGLNQWSNDGPFLTFIAPEPPRAGAFYPVGDTYIQGGFSAGKNYGSEESLLIKNMDADKNVTRQALLKYDLSGYTGEVGSAKLRVYTAVADAPSVGIQFYGIENDSWNEQSVTWNTKPEMEHDIGSAGLNQTWKWVEVDVTAFVKKQLAEDKIAGFGIVQLAPEGAVAKVNSRENALNRPYLELSPQRVNELSPVWHGDAAVQVTAMTETGLVLNWSAAASDTTGYRVYSNGTLIGTTDSGSRTLPITGLEAGKKYTFKVEAGNQSGQWSTDGPFITVRIPKTELVPVVLGNVFSIEEPVQMRIETTRPNMTWKVLDWKGEAVSEGTAVSSGGAALIDIPTAKLGYFTFQARVESVLYEPVDLVTSFTVVPAPADLASLEGSPFGVATHLHRTFFGWTPELTQLMRYAGIKMVRDGIEWPSIERTKGEYTFTGPDAYMGELRDENFDFLFVSGFNNPLYDNNSTPYTDEGRQGFANYVKAYADKYADFMDAFEVYNEFNGGFGDRGTGPADSKPDYYYKLLKTTYETVKPAHPGLPVVGMVTAGTPLTWMEEVFKLGGLNYMDAVSFHPYRYPDSPDGMGDVIQGLDQLIRKYNNGQPKPMWISEFGWPTFIGAKGVTEKVQADYVLRSHVVALSKGVEKIIWYDFMNDGTVKDLNEDNFGIIRNVADEMGPHSPKPAYAVYAAMTKELTHAEFVREEKANPAVKSFVFDQNGQPLRVLWSAAASTSAALLTDQPVQILDMMGNVNTLVPYEGKVYLTLTGEPVYIKGNITGIALDATFSLNGPGAYAGEPVDVTVTMSNSGLQELMFALDVEGQRYPLQADAGATVSREVRMTGLDQPGQRFMDGWLYAGSNRVGYLRYAATVQPSYEITIHPAFSDTAATEQALKFKIKNLSAEKPLSVVKAEWKLGAQSGTEQWNAALNPGEMRTFTIPIRPTPIGAGNAAQVKLALGTAGSYSYQGNLEFNPIFPGTIQAVDGVPDPEITASAPIIDLAKGTNKISGYQGAADLGGGVWLHYDRDNLYLTARIQDNLHAYPKSGAEIWQNDSIQFGISKGLPGQSTDWYEYGLSQTGNGPQLYRWTAPKGKAAGTVDNGQLQIKRDETKKTTVYELALPWSELEPVRVAKDGVISFSLLVNDNDGNGRRGWIEWGSGIGEGKQLSKFRTMQWIVTDGTPPATAAVLEGLKRGDWYTGSVRVGLSATDDGSGVAETVYSPDGGITWKPYLYELVYDEDGDHTLAFRSIDYAGNEEQPQTVALSIDRTPPVIRISGGGTYAIDQTVTVTCTAEDTVSGVVYSHCTAPLVNNPAYRLNLGDHTVTADAMDAAGNTGSASVTVTVMVTLDSLIKLTKDWITGPGSQGIANSLVQKLQHGQYGAFANEVQAQKGKKISEEDAVLLIKFVQELQ